MSKLVVIYKLKFAECEVPLLSLNDIAPFISDITDLLLEENHYIVIVPQQVTKDSKLYKTATHNNKCLKKKLDVYKCSNMFYKES